MRLLAVIVILPLAWSAAQTSPAPAQTGAGNPQQPTSPATGVATTPPMLPILSVLDHLQGSATATAALLERLKIEKWKADGESKRQAQSNAQSIERNLTSALPGMISSVRANPQDLTAQFKLYRNLNALYDVMSSLTESTGAFGPKNDYEALAAQLGEFDASRRKVGDSIEQLAASNQSQIEQLRNQVHTLQQAAVVAAPPKKVVVDNAEPPKKASAAPHKKKAAPPATPSSGTTETGSPASAAPPK